MKRNDLLVSLAIALLLGLSAYWGSDAWYFGVAVGLACLAVALAYVMPASREYAQKCRKRHECYLFVHGYLVTLSVSISLEKAFESASKNLGPEFHELDATLETMQAKEKTEYLVTYFGSDVYRMFLSVLQLYLDRGGDVLKLSSELTAEASREEETEQSYQKMALRKAFGFGFLWLMSLAILMFLRLGLNTFFTAVRHSLPYLLSLGAFYLFFIGSVAWYAHAYTGVPLWKKRRKAKVHEAA